MRPGEVEDKGVRRLTPPPGGHDLFTGNLEKVSPRTGSGAFFRASLGTLAVGLGEVLDEAAEGVRDLLGRRFLAG